MIRDAQRRQAHERRRFAVVLATTAAVALIACALLPGGGSPRAGVAASGHASAPSRLASNSMAAVLRDCGEGNDPLRGRYTPAALEAALARLRPLRARYSTCTEAVAGAIPRR